MKAIMLMFDSLNRRRLSPYGAADVHTPNFDRLARRSVTFDRCYAGSLPCMPARRELHTGRYNFLHRSWGPLEPFDDSMPEILKNNGIYTHLATDHYHYFEDGGSTYHSRFSSWEMFRGQEGDPWKGLVDEPAMEPNAISRKMYYWRQYWVNRGYLKDEADFSQTQTMEAGLHFINRNSGSDNWYLQLELFDPHEPYDAPQRFREIYAHEYGGRFFTWPPYGPVTDESESEIDHVRRENAALVSMCDYNLGRLLDAMDEHDLWKDTMLIVNTDHGFLLGEHNWFGKNVPPEYNEIAHIPMLIWDPRYKRAGERCEQLAQTIDIVPTLYEFFGVPVPPDTQGRSLAGAAARDEKVREAGLFGLHGGHLNCTDGRYVLMRAPVEPDSRELYNYTLLPVHLNAMFSNAELKTAALHPPFSFTKDLNVLKIQAKAPAHDTIQHTLGDLLFDLERDPEQLNPLDMPDVKEYMMGHIRRLLKESDAPPEIVQRYGAG